MFGDWKNLGCLHELVNKAKIAPANLESSTALASFSLVVFVVEIGLFFVKRGRGNFPFNEISFRIRESQK